MSHHIIVIGGGFFGCCIALRVAQAGRSVLIVEREDNLLTRASYVNQARIHTGYHYPRSLRTAASSRNNLSRFVEQFSAGVDGGFTALYALASVGSKVERRYFESFCKQLDLPLKPASAHHARLFSPRHIQAVYECEEYAFDALAIRAQMTRQLEEAGVAIRFGAEAVGVSGDSDNVLVRLRGGEEIHARWGFNATYASINTLPGVDLAHAPRLKQQIAEVCLIEPPPALAKLGVTVMDGQYMSTMPFPARRLHSLTHVRYTPHHTWIEDARSPSPDAVLRNYAKESRFAWMQRDSERFLPCLAEARYVESLFDVKTTLLSAEVDDARPMTFLRDARIPALITVLGGKLDNVYDVLHYLETQLDL